MGKLDSIVGNFFRDEEKVYRKVTPKGHGLGWHPSIPDKRDFTYSVPYQVQANLPTSVDLRPQFPPVYDQMTVGSCTANAIAGILEYEMMKQKEVAFVPSRLFIYYNERAMEGTTSSDSGASISDGIKSVNTLGVCPETEWVYDTTKVFTRPSDQCYTDALLHKALQYASVPQNLQLMKAALAAGNPIVGGFTIYESFESEQVAQTGIVPMPGSSEQVLGGHAVCIVGFDDSKQMFLIRNSWGNWGISGYCWMPYQYWTDPNLSDDFWVINLVS